MIELGKISWYTLPPISNNLYFGTVKDWTQTLATKINQAGATLFQNRSLICNTEEDYANQPVIYRMIVVPNSFEKQFKMLEYFDPIKSTLAGRFDVEFSDVKNIAVIEKFSDREYNVTIELIHENHR